MLSRWLLVGRYDQIPCYIPRWLVSHLTNSSLRDQLCPEIVVSFSENSSPVLQERDSFSPRIVRREPSISLQPVLARCEAILRLETKTESAVYVFAGRRRVIESPSSTFLPRDRG